MLAVEVKVRCFLLYTVVYCNVALDSILFSIII